MELAIVAALPFLAVWVYEVSNMIALSIQGDQVSLTVAGWVPVGVAGVSQGALSPVTKVAQVLLCTSLLALPFSLLARARFLVAKSFVLTTIAAFAASTYWELLSQLTVLSMAAHTAIFLAGTVTVSYLLIREFMVPRSMKARLPVLTPRNA